MKDLDAIARDARGAYERARFEKALLIASPVVPMALVCGLLTGAGEPCFCLGAFLAAAVIVADWHGRFPSRAARWGLTAGMLPALAFASMVLLDIEAQVACAVGGGLSIAGGVYVARACGSYPRGLLTAILSLGFFVGTASLGNFKFGGMATIASGAGFLLGAGVAVLIMIMRRRG